MFVEIIAEKCCVFRVGFINGIKCITKNRDQSAHKFDEHNADHLPLDVGWCTDFPGFVQYIEGEYQPGKIPDTRNQPNQRTQPEPEFRKRHPDVAVGVVAEFIKPFEGTAVFFY